MEKEISEINKICLNCSVSLHGKFCHECGQESSDKIVPLDESFSELLAEFLKFDAKFLSSMWSLLVKPGFLTRAYAAGRRAAYLQPIKLYLTINFILFLLASWFDPVAVTQDEIIDSLPNTKLSLEVFNSALSAILPPLLILIIPPFAGILKILYIRSKQFFALHFIFSIHFLSFFMLATIPGLFYESILYWFTFPISALYLLIALKIVYQQSWLKTFIKFLFAAFSFLILFITWFAIGYFYATAISIFSS